MPRKESHDTGRSSSCRKTAIVLRLFRLERLDALRRQLSGTPGKREPMVRASRMVRTQIGGVLNAVVQGVERGSRVHEGPDPAEGALPQCHPLPTRRSGPLRQDRVISNGLRKRQVPDAVYRWGIWEKK